MIKDPSLRNVLENNGWKYSKVINMSDQNYKTHNFNNFDVCEVCGLELEDASPYIISPHDLSCNEYLVKNIIK